jgi:hypothetical protein
MLNAWYSNAISDLNKSVSKKKNKVKLVKKVNNKALILIELWNFIKIDQS